LITSGVLSHKNLDLERLDYRDDLIYSTARYRREEAQRKAANIKTTHPNPIMKQPMQP
jgi:hypothetical protein